MDMQAIKDEVLLKLTGNVVSFELTDATLTMVVNSALREVQRYIDTFRFVTVPYARCIDVSEHNISSVIAIKRTEGYLVSTDNGSYGISDPMYASYWQLFSTSGNIYNMSDFAYNYASWNTLSQIRNTISTDLSYYFEKSTNKLYVNVSTGQPKEITIMYIPQFKDVSEITSDFWIDVLVRMSVALAKITVGRVRTKFKQSNAPWVMDGDQILEEGNTELTNLRQELKDSTQLVYGID